MIVSIKRQLQNLDRRNYLIHQLDPEFNDLQFMRSHVSDEYIELHKLDVKNFGEKIKLNLDDISQLSIDSINIYIELKNGTSYSLKELRNNLQEIFDDFTGDTLEVDINGYYVLKDYSLIKQDYGIYILRGIKIFDADLGKLEEDKYEQFEYKIKFDDIREIDEDHEENYHHLQSQLANGQYIEFTSEGDNNEN